MLTLAGAFMSGVMFDMGFDSAVNGEWGEAAWEAFLCLANGFFAVLKWKSLPSPPGGGE